MNHAPIRRVLVLQHEAYEPLGTLDAVLRKERVRIRYVNFERDPDAHPRLEGYHGLILLGGWMGVNESHKYTHLKTEMRLVEAALKLQIPILGICLGSQILAHVLGARVYSHSVREMGWTPLHRSTTQVPLFYEFRETEHFFQSHGDTYDLPAGALRLFQGDSVAEQGFLAEGHALGLQFHLEIDEPTLQDWLQDPQNQPFFHAAQSHFSKERILQDTKLHLERSLKLSRSVFTQWIRGRGEDLHIRLGSGHGKTERDPA